MRGFVARHHVGLVLTAALALHAYALKSADTDFAIFERAAQRFIAGEALYRAADAESGTEWTDRTFKYPPAAAAFFVPLGHRGLFLLVSALALLVAAHWAAQASGAQRLHWLPLVLLASYSHALFSLGQSDGLVLGLFAASELARAKRPWLAAGLAAAAVLLKVTFVGPVLLVALVRRDGAGVARFGAMLLALGAGLPLLRYGPMGALEQHQAWLGLLSQTTPPLLCRASNQGVWAMACRGPAVVIATVSGVALLGVLWAWWRKPTDFEVAATGTFMAALWSPLCWRSTLVCLLPAYFFIVTGRRPLNVVAGVAALAAAFPIYDVLGAGALDRALHLRLHGALALATFAFGALATRARTRP
ncbi:MAG: DUF2029 domain-containing protein [Myxococcaceae bacterium]|nr:DUF2029 domain-containing protein [Myxococcaceae bacterium]